MAAPDISELRVLVVDDEVFMQNLIARILGKLGVREIEKAANGDDALRVLDREGSEVDVILCDLNMPTMDGIEFLRHLADRDCEAGIILISGEDKRVLKTSMDLAHAQDLHVLGSLSKPVAPEELRDLLQRFGEKAATTARHASSPISEEALRAGIEEDHIHLVYQPKVSTASRELVGVESLVRWQDPKRGAIGPDAFIPTAEESGLIVPLTEVVIRKALAQAGAWFADGLDVKMSVNLSVDCLSRLDLPEFIVSLATAEGVDVSKLILELTESRLMKESTVPLEILTRLRVKGMGLSIDDFGTGYSSFQQLRRIPFTELKIDRAFVHGATQDPDARAILESSVELAKRLELTIVAEGVETQEDWDLVAELGCDLVQGYFVAKPMPADQLETWLQS